MNSIRPALTLGLVMSLFLAVPLTGSAKEITKETAAVAAPAETSPSTESSPWYVGMGTGMNLPLSGASSNYFLGGGGTALIGYRLDSHFALQLDVNQWFWAGSGHATYDLRPMPELRWMPGSGSLSPYFIAGFGYDLRFNSPNGYNASAPVGFVGLGLQYELRPGEHAFLEARYNYLFYTDVSPQEIPVILGLTEDL